MGISTTTGADVGWSVGKAVGTWVSVGMAVKVGVRLGNGVCVCERVVVVVGVGLGLAISACDQAGPASLRISARAAELLPGQAATVATLHNISVNNRAGSESCFAINQRRE